MNPHEPTRADLSDFHGPGVSLADQTLERVSGRGKRGSMSDDLRDEFARALMESWRSRPSHPVAFKYTFAAMADAAWEKVAPELDRLRAEVKRWEQDYPCDGGCVEYPEECCSRHGRKPDDIWRIVNDVGAERDDALAECAVLRESLADESAARRVAADCADRFRDVLSEVLGLGENPGDDELVRQIRDAHGKYGPEPRRWRDLMTGAEAVRDQIIAERREALASVPEPSEPAADGGVGGQQTCGAWGGCPLPTGHNMGQADIPENHGQQTAGERP